MTEKCIILCIHITGSEIILQMVIIYACRRMDFIQAKTFVKYKKNKGKVNRKLTKFLQEMKFFIISFARKCVGKHQIKNIIYCNYTNLRQQLEIM